METVKLFKEWYDTVVKPFHRKPHKVIITKSYWWNDPVHLKVCPHYEKELRERLKLQKMNKD